MALRVALRRAVVVFGLMLASSGLATAQGSFQAVTGKVFDSAVPRDFYLEGNSIPVEKSNTVLLRTAAGARVEIGLIDTTGYSSQIQTKYIGMIINEAPLTVCGTALGVGSYGFGLKKAAAGGHGPGEFAIYDQAGASVGNCPAEQDRALKQPKPLQVVESSGRLYINRYWVPLATK